LEADLYRNTISSVRRRTNVLRVQTERDQLQQVDKLEQSLEKKTRTIMLSMKSKLEDELRENDKEIESLHAKVVQMEQDKRDLRREIQEQRIQMSEELRKETLSYSQRLTEARATNQKLTSELFVKITRDEWQLQVQLEHKEKLEG